MTTRFATNMDCCKKFMSTISGLPNSAINPLIGDTVRVYHDSKFEVWMKVVEREWTMTNGTDPVLTCYLSRMDGTTIPQLEGILRENGFRW